MTAHDATAVPPEARAIRATRAWLTRAVVGLNLCPFAKAPLVKRQIRFAVCESDDPRVLLDALGAEMLALAAADPALTETTLLIHPNALLDFLDFNDFLVAADALLEDLALDGVLQVASFHPDYRFADAEPDDPSNATNRSPHPTLHLLRELSVERAVRSFADAGTIVEANMRTLEALGPQGWDALAAHWRAEPAG